jgi:hypothetical protein
VQCLNCHSEVSPGAFVCPYCHYSPFLWGVRPFDGGPSGQLPPATQSCSAFGIALTFGILGVAAVFVLPPLGIGFLIVAGVALLVGIFRRS